MLVSFMLHDIGRDHGGKREMGLHLHSWGGSGALGCGAVVFGLGAMVVISRGSGREALVEIRIVSLAYSKLCRV